MRKKSFSIQEEMEISDDLGETAAASFLRSIIYPVWLNRITIPTKTISFITNDRQRIIRWKLALDYCG